MAVFDEVIYHETRVQSLARHVGLLFVIPLFIYVLWENQFGFELAGDESFYLAPPFKLMSLGDVPFKDERFNAARHADWLNYYLIRPWLPYSVLTYRIVSDTIFGLTLLWLGYLAFGGRLTLGCGLAIAAILAFDSLGVSTFSYNWWCRQGVLFHQIMWLYSRNVSKKNERYFFGLAGMGMGLATVAYNPFVLMLPFLILLGIYTRKRTPFFGWYVLGMLLPIAIDVGYLYWNELFEYWQQSWAVSKSQRIDYNVKGGGFNVAIYILFLMRAPAFWICLLLPLLGHKIVEKRTLWLASFVGVGIFGLYRLSTVFTLIPVSNLYSEISVAVGYVLLILAYKKKDDRRLIMAVLALVCGFIISQASVSAVHSLPWLNGALLIPFLGFIWQTREPVYSRYTYAITCMFVFFILQGTLYISSNYNYWDVPYQKCTHQVQSVPLKGLWTSERRAYLVEQLSQTLEGKRFVISVGVPGAFYFGKVRSTLPTLLASESPLHFRITSLQQMLNEDRFPELLILGRTHPATWGHSNVRFLSTILPGDPLKDFIYCARGRILVDETELAIFEADVRKIAPCVHKVLTESRWLS